MIDPSRFAFLVAHPDCLVAVERQELRDELGHGSDDFIRDVNLVQTVADRRSGKSSRALEMAKLLVLRIRATGSLRTSLWAEAVEKVKTIVAKAIVGQFDATWALVNLVEAGLTEDELSEIAASEGIESGWVETYRMAQKKVPELQESRRQAVACVFPLKRVSPYEREDRDLAIVERDTRIKALDARIVALDAELVKKNEQIADLAAKFDQLLVENVRSNRIVHARVAGTCTCGRYPAGQCSRCRYDDLYEAVRVNEERKTPSDLADSVFEEVGWVCRDVELGLQALDPIGFGEDGRKVVLSSTIEGAREKLRSAMGRLEALRKKR